MRRLLLKVGLLALPFALVAGAVVGIDPYNYFAWNAARVDAARQDVAYRMSPPLWKLAAFRHHPAPNLLLGDSRMASLDAALISKLTGTPFANLGYGGGSLDEAIKTFWLVERRTPLRSVTFGVNLDLYNESNAKDRVTSAEKILANFALYLCDRIVLRTAWYDIAQSTTGKRPTIGVPTMDKDRFWRYQLDVTARIAYESYRYPEAYRRRIEQIADTCRARRIALRFLVFPEHHDLAQVAVRYGLEHAAGRMTADLARIGETIDLRGAVPDSDRALFTDPYHFDPEVGEQLVRRVWGRDVHPSGASPGAAAARIE